MLFFLIAAVVVLCDQLTKAYAVKTLAGTAGRSVLGTLLRLEYVENRGAAFGMLRDCRLFFILLTAVVSVGIVVYWLRHRNASRVLTIGLGLLFGGAVGNFIDRLINGFVVDFLKVDLVSFYEFPVFNVADIGVTCGCLLLLIYFLFLESREKEEK
uniref:signal peptidase II n=1 Tax=Ndongobacter massiliensis TaxID=1871025 RepID=UPI0009319E3B|nr:signal peptidase II [Ndongobacter massiliensis]